MEFHGNPYVRRCVKVMLWQHYSNPRHTRRMKGHLAGTNVQNSDSEIVSLSGVSTPIRVRHPDPSAS